MSSKAALQSLISHETWHWWKNVALSLGAGVGLSMLWTHCALFLKEGPGLYTITSALDCTQSRLTCKKGTADGAATILSMHATV